MTIAEFYFVRHGQTDHNILGRVGTDHPDEIPLNATGCRQAEALAPLIATLGAKSVCASPLKRVQQTKTLILGQLEMTHYTLDAFTECPATVWKDMRNHGMYATFPHEDHPVRPFLDRVANGIDHILSLPGPVLIVAHGGIHWAACCYLGIEDHSWAVDNCAVVHFVKTNGKWSAKLLS